MKAILTIILIGICSLSMAQKTSKFQTVEIKTSALCGDCEERIENALNYSKGIKYADLNLDNKIVTVKFKTKTITLEEVKGLIASIGYHANDVKRDSSAFKELPGCCQDPNATCTKK